MSQEYIKLETLLKELFQLDQPDLDFGLYRIMHAKGAEVTQFLEKDLLPQVRSAFEQYRPADKAAVESELAKAIEQAQALGAQPETLPKVKELRARLTEAVDVGALEREVYDHLYSFFRRYYSEGDFFAKRVYKPGVYAIPYEGEEVTLYWANRDQYYIKTSEFLHDYAFRLRPQDQKRPMRVHFRLADATEGEHSNVKANEGMDRVFVLGAPGDSGRDFATEENSEFSIHFEYRPTAITDWPEGEREGKTRGPVQKDLTALTVERILAVTDAKLAPWIDELRKPHVTSSGDKVEYSRLEAHLKRYSARNTFDYFIHKDLGRFLRGELDFYVKNEVMHLDDVENESAPKVEQYLSKVKVIRKIAGKIIAFLAQLEDFQKKLWLKRKFVVETNYCITLGLVPQGFYKEIAANEAQREEWVRLFSIDEMQGDLTGPAYSVPLTVEFLKAHATLVVDTRHFGATFTERLLEDIGDADAQTDGLLIHSENFQALGMLHQRYRGQVKCVYIDPPYNTDASAIDYKNGYKSSSWLSLIEGRVASSRPLLSEDGVLVAAIDDEQQRELSYVLSDVFDGRLLGTICVRANPSGRPTKTGYSVSHEYLLFAGRGQKSAIGRMPPTDEQRARFSQQDKWGAFEWRNLRREGSNSDRSARRYLYYPIYLRNRAIRVPKMTWDEHAREWVVDERPRPGEQAVWPNNEEGDEKTWRWEWATVMASLKLLSVRKDRSGRDYVYYKRRPNEEGVVSVSSWFDAKYSATEHGTAVLKALFGRSPFSYPKSIYAVEDAIYIGGASGTGTMVLDYFGGSGTTAHAVINLNRKDGGRRKFILVENGNHFHTVLLPRIKKVTFTPDWKNGKPERPATPEETARGPRIVKVLGLESYEDSLNNLELRRSKQQQSVLDLPAAQVTDGLKEQYLLRYILDVETHGSQSLLNAVAFLDPTAYGLKVKRPGSDEARVVNVDLLETFNYLIGLSVQHMAAPQAFAAVFERDSEKRLRLKGRLQEGAANPWWFRTVSGSTPDGRKTLVIWRKRPGGETSEGIEQDNLVLDKWFTAQGYASKVSKFDLIFVNGDNNLENLKTADATWKVRLIEEDFHRLMFDGTSTQP